MAKNMMGFKKVDAIPERKRRGVYDDVIEEVANTGDIYVYDTHDIKRASSLQTTLRYRIRKLGVSVKVLTRDTKVCLVAKPAALVKHDRDVE